ncbi:MAG: diacylglycerol kinase family protein [Ginsengibacter sp.]
MKQTKTNNVFKAFSNAFAGLIYFFRYERNGRIQLVIGILTVILSILLQIEKYEWIAVLLCIGGVLCAEMINSALEKLCNYTQPLFNIQIKIIKDVAAGAVLFISIISALTGTLIFLPKLWQLL